MSEQWLTIRLGDVLRRVKDEVTVQDDEVYTRLTIRMNGKGIVPRDQVPGHEIGTKKQFIARGGQLVLSKIDARNGAFGILPSRCDKAIITGNFWAFDANDQRVFPAYLDYLTRTPLFVDFCIRASEGTTNRLYLQEDRFLAQEIALPPLEEQRRIVARIDELAAYITEARSLHQRVSDETEALASAATDAAFSSLSERLGCKRLGDVCTGVTDGDHNTPAFAEAGVRFIFVGNVSSGRLHFEGSKRVDEQYFGTLKPRRIPRRGDILYSAVGATLGVPAVVDTDEVFCFQRHIAILKPDHSTAESRFIWHMLRSRTAFGKAWSWTTGSAQPTVPLRAICELPIPVPPLAEQRRIVAELDVLQAEVDVLTRLQAESAAELDALLPSILDAAFKGEL
jgi:type I restriction enzyme S subunit